MSKRLLLTISAVMALVTAELLARGFYHQQTTEGLYPQIYRSSDILPWELLPGAKDTVARRDEPEVHSDIVINSLGYRGPEFELEKPPETLRILVVGDSFVFGWGVEDEQGVTRVLEKLLQSHFPSRKIQVINAGFAAGFSPDTFYVYLRNRGILLNPDLVILSFLPVNDLDNIASNVLVLDARGEVVRILYPTEYVDADHRRRGRSFLTSAVPALDNVYFIQVASQFVRSWYWRYRLPDFLTEKHIETRKESWEVLRKCLRASAELLYAEGHRARLAVMVIPDSLQVHRESWDIQRLHFDPLLFDNPYAQNKFATLAHAEGIQYLDLLPEMRERGESERLYFKHDGHWNAAGHRVAAESIARFLLERGWL